ncbi:hypothetical protein HNR08_003401 [Cellulomonas hominis]|uniref:Uncharacterized protein n=1 Tax=Cellulomonas hominis TaxID=156981 RepID=A0A7W8WAR0_9CELL|nr:hypothetical protein [Cellulomonas hominis]MBB5474665.1 hypothetical protein [Cellulomonas hominis]
MRAGGQFTIDPRGESAATLDLQRAEDALDADDTQAAREILARVLARFEHLTAAEVEADDRLRASWLESATLMSRARETHARAEDAALREATATGSVRGHGQVVQAAGVFDARRVAVSAAQDLEDINSMMRGTVLGLAKARAVVNEHEHLVAVGADDLAPARLERAALALLATESASTQAFRTAAGTLPLTHPDYPTWAGVVPVAVEVPDSDRATLLRVAMVDVRRSRLVGRVTLPAARCRNLRGQFSMTAVAGAVRWMAAHREPAGSEEGMSRARACANLLAELDRTIPPF